MTNTWTPPLARFREAAGRLTRPSGPPPRPTRSALAWDALLALVLGVAMIDYALDAADGRRQIGPYGVSVVIQPMNAALLVTLAVVASSALALRRRYPLAVLWVVQVAAMLTPQEVPRLTFYALLVAVYSAATHSPYRVLTLASLPVSLLPFGMSGDAASPVIPAGPVPAVVSDEYVPLLILVPIAVMADGLRRWKRRTDESHARLAALERERDAALRRAVEHERARIARELHDVVTHNVSVMVIQAGAARTIMAAEPERAGAALREVEAGGRAALSELRHVMGLLTMDDERSGGTEELTPQPDLDRLPALVRRMRSSGVAVELAVAGEPRPLPPGIELAAYRVVQEALTNAVKHASGADVRVTVDHGTERLRVAVADAGGEPGPGAADGGGRGLLGLRERLSVYGGTLTAGPRPLGGYRVEAEIPLAPGEEP
ncbi:sensor histidine kinase [Streptomyces hainanensis]|uniref:sensor histidine kinase n=1 Tax=Streptomyces hainanensis TaxID=402648 RepID=UPI003C79D462